MFEALKNLLRRRRAPEVEYDPTPKDSPRIVPAGPPTSAFPPAAPIEDPKHDEPEH